MTDPTVVSVDGSATPIVITNDHSIEVVSELPPTSNQNWATPPEFIRAVERRFGKIGFDLAASAGNAKAARYFTEEDDALKQDWSVLPDENGHDSKVVWLNPPYKNIAPWAEMCASVRTLSRWTLMLVPASIGTAWFAEHVIDSAFVLGISPRLTFVSATAPYPKDLMVAAYGFSARGFDTWRWDDA